MAEEPPPSRWRAFMGFVQQSQVLLALAVAGFGLMFNFSEQRREQLGLNRTAVETARGEAIRAEFRDDPHNTLAEFKATFPRHAFCAALGFFVAENGRLNRSRLDRPNEEVRRMNDALLLEVEALAETEGVGADALARLRADAAARATAGDEPGCAAVRAARGPAFFAAPECLLVIDSFGQNECNIARWTAQRRDAIRAEQLAMGVPVPPPPPPADIAPGPAPPAERPAPSGPCPTPPLVFTQFVDPADRAAVEALRDELLQAGWQVAPPENAPEGRTTGDVRIYWEDQRPCAEALAALVAAAPQVRRPIRVISLAGRYHGLPRGQMELWLPALD